MRMKAAALAGILFFGFALAADPIPDSDLGLSRTSVFDTPLPEPFDYDGSAGLLPALSADEPPMIPHEIRSFEQITVSRNRCLRCHLLPEQVGETVAEGDATPIPADHYLSLPEGDQPAKLDGGRWVCTQCHVSQSNSEQLVRNTTVQ